MAGGMVVVWYSGSTWST